MMNPFSLVFGSLFLAMLVRFSVARCCCAEPCSFACDSGTTPFRVQVDFGGSFTNNNCADCSSWHTTSWICNQFGGDPPWTVIATACNWGLDHTTLPCGGPDRYDICSLWLQSGVTGWDIFIGYRAPVGNVCLGYDGQWNIADTVTYDCSESQSFGSADWASPSGAEYQCVYNAENGHTLVPLG